MFEGVKTKESYPRLTHIYNIKQMLGTLSEIDLLEKKKSHSDSVG